MPHRSEERPGKGAHHRGRGKGTDAEDSTLVSHGTAVGYTPPRRKSGPGRWVRLADVLLEVDVDPALRAVLEAGRRVDAEPGDGVAAFLPDGRALLFLATPQGLEVRRDVTDDEVRLFLSRSEVAA